MLNELPKAIVVVDVRKEQSAVREAQRLNIPVIGIVDTNANPSDISYVIPANDDAVGSVQLIISAIAEAYREGHEKLEKETAKAAKAEEAKKAAQEKKEPAKEEAKPEVAAQEKPVKKEAAKKTE